MPYPSWEFPDIRLLADEGPAGPFLTIILLTRRFESQNTKKVCTTD